MIRPRSLLLDTNIWLDYFLGTGSSIDAISQIVESGASGSVSLLFAPTSAKDLFYILPRRLRRASGGASPGCGEDASYRAVAWACVERMMELAAAAPLSHAECQLARNRPMPISSSRTTGLFFDPCRRRASRRSVRAGYLNDSAADRRWRRRFYVGTHAWAMRRQFPFLALQADGGQPSSRSNATVKLDVRG